MLISLFESLFIFLLQAGFLLEAGLLIFPEGSNLLRQSLFVLTGKTQLLSEAGYLKGQIILLLIQFRQPAADGLQLFLQVI